MHGDFRFKGVIQDLSEDQKDHPLIRLFTSGRGNIDFVQNLLQSAENDE